MRILKWLIGIGLLAVLIAIFVSPRKPAGGEAPAVTYQTAALSRGEVVLAITATGTVQARSSVQVGSQVSGIIREVFVTENDLVHGPHDGEPGDVLAIIDPTALQAALDQSQANLLIERANLERAGIILAQERRNLERMTDLSSSRFVSESEIELAQQKVVLAEADVEVGRARIAQAEARVASARVDLGNTIIRSSTDGMVMSVAIQPGQTVAASLQAPTLFTIAKDLRRMTIEANIDEVDVGLLDAGEPSVAFTVFAFPTLSFSGTIDKVFFEPTITDNVVTYRTLIRVENEDLRLRPGMTANVTITLDERHDVLRLPIPALSYLPKGQALPARAGAGAETPHVWILKDGKPAAVPVRLGLSDGIHVELLDAGGLAVGDRVITGEQASEQGGGLFGRFRR